jgi:hypothetical protein
MPAEPENLWDRTGEMGASMLFENNQDILTRKMAAAITALISRELTWPIYGVTVGSNDSITAIHYLNEADPRHPVADYAPNGLAGLPIQVFLTDGGKTGRFVIRESGPDTALHLLP